MSDTDKPLVWLHGEIKTPPFSEAARLETGALLRRLQKGERLRMPQSRPMPNIGVRCHELRVNDEDHTWRTVYKIEADAIVILDVFDKKSRETSQSVIDTCKDRIKRYEAA